MTDHEVHGVVQLVLGVVTKKLIDEHSTLNNNHECKLDGIIVS